MTLHKKGKDINIFYRTKFYKNYSYDLYATYFFFLLRN